MKIFLSHSSHDKAIIREIISFFPDYIQSWINETDLLVGEDILYSIKNTIELSSDFLVVFITYKALQSQWVQKELGWALEKEKKINRTFLLPVILENIADPKDLPDYIRSRKYLNLVDHTRAGIQSFSNSLVWHLFALLVKDISNSQKRSETNNSAISLLDEADRLISTIAHEIRLLVYPFRKENPLEIEKLFQTIIENDKFKLTPNELYNVLGRLQHQGHLAGLVLDGTSIYVEEEHFAWKTAFNLNAKKKIAKKASSLIKSNYTIVLDSGSTTLELAKQIAAGLKLKTWKNLRFITNSIPATNEIVTVASEMGLEDENPYISVYLVGGRVRTNTLAVVSDNINPASISDFRSILNLLKLEYADLGFLGTNGVHQEVGFTTHSEVEMRIKQQIIACSKDNYVLTDISKFDIKEFNTFANFDSNLNIITIKEDFDVLPDEYRNALEKRSTKLILA